MKKPNNTYKKIPEPVLKGGAVLLICFILLALPVVLKAQMTEGGFKGGLNVSTLWGGFDPDEKSAFVTGIHAGVFTVHKLNETFSLQPELLYSRQGNKTTYSYVSGGESYKNSRENRETHIVIPVLLKYNSALPVDLLAGPQLGILFSGFKGTLGLSAGAEYQLNDHFVSGARINLGLTKTTDGHRDLVFQFYVAYRGLLNISKIKLLEPL
ncbi:MAG: porin family protein [Mangrovibacterium sp.]|nr:porin family protein [Mangrovibacterium sp.]